MKDINIGKITNINMKIKSKCKPKGKKCPFPLFDIGLQEVAFHQATPLQDIPKSPVAPNIQDLVIQIS